MPSWQVQNAKARFCELLDAVVEEGPQMLTRRGIEIAVLVPIEEWRRLKSSARLSLKDLLLTSSPRFEIVCPSRGSRRRRQTVEYH